MRIKKPIVRMGQKSTGVYKMHIASFMKKFTPDRLEDVAESLLEIAGMKGKVKDRANAIKATELIFKITLSIYALFPKDEDPVVGMEGQKEFSRTLMLALQKAESECDQKLEEEGRVIEQPKEIIVEHPVS